MLLTCSVREAVAKVGPKAKNRTNYESKQTETEDKRKPRWWRDGTSNKEGDVCRVGREILC